MNCKELMTLIDGIYYDARNGIRIMLVGDSFFVGVVEKELLSRLSADEDVSLLNYRTTLSVNFRDGGQIIVVDFFDKPRGLFQFQCIDHLDEIIVLESVKDSMTIELEQHITPLANTFVGVSFRFLEV